MSHTFVYVMVNGVSTTFNVSYDHFMCFFGSALSKLLVTPRLMMNCYYKNSLIYANVKRLSP